MSEAVLTPGQHVRPVIDDSRVHVLVKDLYGLEVISTAELNSYDDRNFHVQVKQHSDNPNIPCVSSHGYVLKILNSLDSKFEAAIDAQNALIRHLTDAGLSTPKVLLTKDGRTKSLQTVKGGRYLVRLLEFLPGTILQEVSWDTDVAYQTGKLAGKLDRYCKNFHHPGYDNYSRIWNMAEVPKLTDFLTYIDEPEQRAVIHDVIRSFQQNVINNYDRLSKGVIHGDVNEQNVLLQKKDDGKYHVTGLLDFGDSAYSCYVFEVAICMVYLMLECDKTDPLETSGYALAGYLSEFQLPPADLQVLKDCVCARIVQSMIIGAYTAKMNPDKSDYYLKAAHVKWTVLNRTWNTPIEELTDIWQTCCQQFNINFTSAV